MDDASTLPGFWEPAARETLFVLRLKDERFNETFFRQWIDGWSASSMLFLSSLRSVSLFNLRTRQPLVQHALHAAKEVKAELPYPRARDATRIEFREVGSSRRWTVFRVRYPVPRDMSRINKALGDTVELAVATSNRAGDSRLYAGLPLDEPSTLPFSCAAPFDINVDRTELLDNRLNEWLLTRVADLLAAAVEETFRTRPKDAWRWIPLSTEAGGKRGSWLHAQVADMCRRVRSRVGDRVRIQAADGSDTKLSDLLIEDEALGSALHRLGAGDSGPRSTSTLAA